MTHPILDRHDVLQVLYHPRPDYGIPYSTQDVHLVLVPVEPSIVIGGRLYPASPDAPAILYFHGNGEIAEDYDDIAKLYIDLGITFLVMDYRGYGISTGEPTSAHLLNDAVRVFVNVRGIFSENGLDPKKLFVMGRSLGSAASIEVALHAGERLAGIIVESGFADTFALLSRLGIEVHGKEDKRHGFGNLSKIAQVETPTLVIHGDEDKLIPMKDGQALYESCGAKNKHLVLIPGGTHNDLMFVGRGKYFGAIKTFVQGAASDAHPK